MAKYVGFCLDRRSYLIWSAVVVKNPPWYTLVCTVQHTHRTKNTRTDVCTGAVAMKTVKERKAFFYFTVTAHKNGRVLYIYQYIVYLVPSIAEKCSYEEKSWRKYKKLTNISIHKIHEYIVQQGNRCPAVP